MSVLASVIVLAYNGEKFLEACLDSVLKQDYPTQEVIVVDNASSDQSVAIAEKYAPSVQVIRNVYNLGYSAGNNAGIRTARGDVIVLLNQDTLVQPGWLSAMVETFDDPSVGVVGCKMLYPNSNSLQHAGGLVNPDDAFTRHIGWDEDDQGQYDSVSEPDFVTGASLAIGRHVLRQLDGLDEGFYPAFYEDLDYCYRARRAGFRIVYQPRAVLSHHETTTLPADSYERVSAFHRSRVRFVLRNWDVDALKQFINAERSALLTNLPLNDAIARARAYWDNMLAVPMVVCARQHDPTLGGTLARGHVAWLLDVLQGLRAESHQRVFSLLTQTDSEDRLSIPAERTFESEPTVLTDLRAIQDALGAARAESLLREPTVKSRLPILGALVNAFHSFWNWLVIRHYLTPIMRQQSAHNRRLHDLVAQLAAVNQSLADQMRSQVESFETELQSQRAVAEQELKSLEERNDALSRLQQIQSEDQAQVSKALLDLYDRVELKK